VKNIWVYWIHLARDSIGALSCDHGHNTRSKEEGEFLYNVTNYQILKKNILSRSITYLLTPRTTVLLEKLTGSQLVKKFPTFYGTRKFITAFTSACHLSLSWARSSQSTPLDPTSWRSILILSSHLTPESSQWSRSLRFSHQNPVYKSPLPYTLYMPRPSHSSRFFHPNDTGWTVQTIKHLII
jgi:hypothetical protein